MEIGIVVVGGLLAVLIILEVLRMSRAGARLTRQLVRRDRREQRVPLVATGDDRI